MTKHQKRLTVVLDDGHHPIVVPIDAAALGTIEPNLHAARSGRGFLTLKGPNLYWIDAARITRIAVDDLEPEAQAVPPTHIGFLTTSG